MRVLLVLCDRCKSEMPPAKGAALNLGVTYKLEGKRLRSERYAVELCEACRAAFGAWIGEAGTNLPGLTPETRELALPPAPPVPEVPPGEVALEPIPPPSSTMAVLAADKSVRKRGAKPEG